MNSHQTEGGDRIRQSITNRGCHDLPPVIVLSLSLLLRITAANQSIQFCWVAPLGIASSPKQAIPVTSPRETPSEANSIRPTLSFPGSHCDTILPSCSAGPPTVCPLTRRAPHPESYRGEIGSLSAAAMRSLAREILQLYSLGGTGRAEQRDAFQSLILVEFRHVFVFWTSCP